MGTSTTTLLQNPDPADTYQTLFDSLGKAYWEASTIEYKDLLHGTQEAIGEIITAYDEQDLANNTQLFIQLSPKIKDINNALKTIQTQISQITKNINTISEVVGGIAKVLSLFPALA